MGYYQKCGTKNRTVLVRMPWWPVDFQALPPRCWCAKCGGEVYGKGKVCRRCQTVQSAKCKVQNGGVPPLGNN